MLLDAGNHLSLEYGCSWGTLSQIKKYGEKFKYVKMFPHGTTAWNLKEIWPRKLFDFLGQGECWLNEAKWSIYALVNYLNIGSDNGLFP